MDRLLRAEIGNKWINSIVEIAIEGKSLLLGRDKSEVIFADQVDMIIPLSHLFTRYLIFSWP
jgi:hypothetical protein